MSGRAGATLSSVQNAARLLKEFGTAEGSLGVTELARRLDLGKSTVHRLLATLTAERILEHDPATGTYRLGLMMWELGARVSVHRVLHDAGATTAGLVRAQALLARELAPRDPAVAAASDPAAIRAALLQALRVPT